MPAESIPAISPIQPQTGSIVVGIFFTGLALWALLSWIPAHSPWTADKERAVVSAIAHGSADSLKEWRLKPGPYYGALAFAILVGLAGISRILRGATHRPQPKRR
ncbi:MAG: hypothetical protein K8W52_24285 [Deltaproteobacteria bacterium]|nr:hypothetical protein [Deltaproteobacteria bacterium]